MADAIVSSSCLCEGYFCQECEIYFEEDMWGSGASGVPAALEMCPACESEGSIVEAYMACDGDCMSHEIDLVEAHIASLPGDEMGGWYFVGASNVTWENRSGYKLVHCGDLSYEDFVLEDGDYTLYITFSSNGLSVSRASHDEYSANFVVRPATLAEMFHFHGVAYHMADPSTVGEYDNPIAHNDDPDVEFELVDGETIRCKACGFTGSKYEDWTFDE